MAGEVTTVNVTEQTLYNLTITETDGTTLTLSLTDPVLIVNTTMAEIDATMVNNGTGLGVYKRKDMTQFVMRSITDDDKTIDTSIQNNDNEIRIKLPDAGISTPDDFQINADSDSSAKIELPGPTVDLSKAKLLTDLDVNSKDLDSVNTITATTGDITTVTSTTGNITTVNATDVNSTTGDITTVNSTNVNTTNLDVDTGTIDDLTSTTVDINGGSIDGTTVGATTSSTGRFSTLASDSVDLNGGAIDGTTIGASSPSTIVTTDLTATTADINAGTIDNTTIGATTPSTIVTTDLTATTADINGGTIDGTVVGDSTPAAVSTTALVATTADINAGTIDNSIIGGTTPNLGTFTTLGATVGNITTVNASTVNATNQNLTGDADVTGDLTVGGTAAVTGDFQIGSTMSVYGTAVFNADSNMASGKRFSTDLLTVGTTATINSANITTGTVTTGNITTVNATDVNVSDDLVVTDDASVGGDLAVTGNTVLTGNLTVNGTQTIVNTETLTVDDNIIVLNNNITGTPSEDAGLEIERGTSSNVSILWNETTDVFEFKEGSGLANIKAYDAEFTDDLTVGDNFTVGGDMTVNGTSHFSVLGFTNRVVVDVNDPATSSGHGIVLWNSDVADRNLTTSNNLDDVLHGGGTVPDDSSSYVCPIVYITNESIEVHQNAAGTGGTGETHTNITAGVLNIQTGNTLDDGETTIEGGNIGATRSVVVGGSTPYTESNAFSAPGGFFTTVVPSVATGEPLEDRHWHGSFLGSSGKEFAQLHVKEIYGTEMHGDLIPGEDITHSLGSASNQWKEVFIGPGSLYIDGHKVLGSDATDTINISTDTGQTLDIFAGGASGTAGVINMASRGNVTSLNDTTVNLGPSVGGGTINTRGTLEASDLHNGDLEFSGTLINQTATNQNLEIRTNGTGYLHLNSADVYVGPVAGAIKLDENSITVSNANGDLNLLANGTGAVAIDELSITHGTFAWGETYNQIEADADRVFTFKASGNGYLYNVAPSFWLGDGSSGAYFQSNSGAASTLKPWGQDMAIGPHPSGNFEVTLEGDLTKTNTNTKGIVANTQGVTIPGVPAWGGFNFLSGGDGIRAASTPATGYPFVGIQQTTNINQPQPEAQYLINQMNYDISGGLAGHGVQVKFAAQDETGKLLNMGANLVKMRNTSESGSAGSSTVDSWDGEYTLTVIGNSGSGADVATNVITTNTDFTEVSQELRVVDKPGNSGSSALSGLYLTYDGAETGTPTGHISLRNEGSSTTTELVELEEDRVSHQVIQKMHTASADPTGEEGDFYFNTTTKKFRGYNGTAWVNFHG